MNKKASVLFLLLLILIPGVLADGFIHIRLPDKDLWQRFNENKQLCAINYQDGYQKMILAIDLPDINLEKELVWIFPIPSTPDKTAIEIIKGFPLFMGKDVQAEAKKIINEYAIYSGVAALVPAFPLGFVFVRGMFGKSVSDLGLFEQTVQVHEHIEKMGLTSELITAQNGEAIYNYLTNKGFKLPEDSLQIINEYIGKEYSFVVSWVSDLKEFKKQQTITQRRTYFEDFLGKNFIGVTITFPRVD